MRSNKIMKRQLGEYDVLQRMTGTYFSWNTLYKKWTQPHPKYKCRVKDLFEHMGISPAKELAVQFYAVMFFFYSLYDGAKDKDEVKKQFETTLDEFTKKLLVGERMTHLFRNLILLWRKTGS